MHSLLKQIQEVHKKRNIDKPEKNIRFLFAQSVGLINKLIPPTNTSI